MASQDKRIGLIAGNGRFPIIFADNARRLGYQVVAVAYASETDAELEHHVDQVHWVKIGQLNQMITVFKHDNIQQVVMLGGIKKTHLFSRVRPDFRALALLKRLKALKDDEILRAIAHELESEGIQVRESTFGLQGILADEGVQTKRHPNHTEWKDIEYGWDILKTIGHLDIGQCVIIKDRVVIAVEAVEGTDDTIRRGGTLAQSGAVVIKRSKPQQDLRFDLPTVGPRTVEAMLAVKATVLAVEAKKTVLLDREELLEKADRAGIAVVGIHAP
ncbi:MAG: DUF1009 domain-containing protein [Nitrospirales bacterium]|nr:DUF1009 domain-containing protein [Nitrospirales bacterium]